jgi:hypothetical protein
MLILLLDVYSYEAVSCVVNISEEFAAPLLMSGERLFRLHRQAGFCIYGMARRG